MRQLSQQGTRLNSATITHHWDTSGVFTTQLKDTERPLLEVVFVRIIMNHKFWRPGNRTKGALYIIQSD